MVYFFEDYREFLKFAFEQKKSSNPSYTMANFAKDLGFTSAYLSFIYSGTRKLTEKSAEKMGVALNMGPLELKYFTLITQYQNEEEMEQKLYFRKKIKEFKKVYNVNFLEMKKYQFISNWKYVALLEMLTLTLGKDKELIKRKLELTDGEMTEILETLEELEFIKVGEDGNIQRNVNGNIKTSNDISHEAIRQFHKQVLQKGIEAIDKQSVDHRSFNGMVLPVNKRKIPEAKKKIQEFLKDMSALMEHEEGDDVYQIEVGFFSLLKDVA